MQLSTRNVCMAILLFGTRAEQNPEKYSTLQVDEKGQDPHTGSGACVSVCVCVCVCLRARGHVYASMCVR